LDAIIFNPDFITIIGHEDTNNYGSIFSFTMNNVHPHDVAEGLSQKGICMRSGHHCCQIYMDHIGVPATTRMSLSFYNTKEEIEQSIVESSTIRQRYVQAAPVAPTQPIAVSEVPASNPAPRTLPPALKRPVELREKEPEDIKAMSLGEFGTKREELLRAITKENVYPNLTQ